MKIDWNMRHEMTPLEFARLREEQLATGLRTLATSHGVKFHEPIQIDSRGEYLLSVSSGFGTLAEVLNKYSPRTGTHPTRHLIPQNCWCMMNHFDVEEMLAKEP